MPAKPHQSPKAKRSPRQPDLPPAFGLPRRISLVDQTVEAMRVRIAGRHWGGTLPGEEEMRGQLGVSRVTLRKALAQLASQGTICAGGRGKRHMVHGMPAASARVGSAGKVVRCLSPHVGLDLVWSTRVIFDEIQTALRTWDLRLEFDHRPAIWLGDPHGRLRRLVAQSQADCWLLYRASPRMQAWFAENRLPCLVLGPCHKGIALPSVEVDVAALGRHAGAEAARWGHRHIAFVVFDPAVASAVATAEGLAGARLRGGEAPRVTVINDDGTVDGLRRKLSAVLQQPDAPTLAMLSTATQVLPVLGILNELKLRMPQDVSLIVRDDEPLLRRSLPELTRYGFDWQRLGRTAARLARDICSSGSGKATRRILLPEFIPGQTLAARRAD